MFVSTPDGEHGPGSRDIATHPTPFLQDQEPVSPSTLPRQGEKSGLRAFLIVRHNEYGLLILEACKKRKGGRHYQLPGGCVPVPASASRLRPRPRLCLRVCVCVSVSSCLCMRLSVGASLTLRLVCRSICLCLCLSLRHVDAHELEHYGDVEGCRIAAARELYEETGMDFRDRLYR